MPFEFRSYGKVVATVYDVEGLGKKLDELSRIDPGCVEYHIREGHISSWLRSIGERPLAESLKSSTSALQASEIVQRHTSGMKARRSGAPTSDITVCRNIKLKE